MATSQALLQPPSKAASPGRDGLDGPTGVTNATSNAGVNSNGQNAKSALARSLTGTLAFYLCVHYLLPGG